MLEVSLRRRLWILAIALSISAPAVGGTIGLSWNAANGATGYRVYYGTTSRQYTNSVDVRNTTQATIQNLTDCTAWYLAVKAYNTAGQESLDFSPEVSGWPAPRLDSLNVASTTQGTQVAMEIRGANFQQGLSLEFVPPSGETIACGGQGDVPLTTMTNPSVSNIQAQSNSATGSCNNGCNCQRFSVTVAGAIAADQAAEVGEWDAIVLDPAGPDGKHVFGRRQQAFEVKVNPIRYDVNTSDEGPTGLKRLTTADTQWLVSSNASFLINPNSCARDARYLELLDLDGNGVIDGAEISNIY